MTNVAMNPAPSLDPMLQENDAMAEFEWLMDLYSIAAREIEIPIQAFHTMREKWIDPVRMARLARSPENRRCAVTVLAQYNQALPDMLSRLVRGLEAREPGFLRAQQDVLDYYAGLWDLKRAGTSSIADFRFVLAHCARDIRAVLTDVLCEQLSISVPLHIPTKPGSVVQPHLYDIHVVLSRLREANYRAHSQLNAATKGRVLY